MKFLKITQDNLQLFPYPQYPYSTIKIGGEKVAKVSKMENKGE